jgi:PIN domain nuclease of toxin-antitoxin system
MLRQTAQHMPHTMVTMASFWEQDVFRRKGRIPHALGCCSAPLHKCTSSL